MANNLTLFDADTNLPTVKRESKLVKNRKPRGNRLNRIATNTNGTFKRIVNGDQVGKAKRGSIDVIIVGHLPDVSRQFYKAKYDPDAKPTLPDCWSNTGEKPDPNAPNQQSKTCANCKQNIAGSGKGKSRACRYVRRIAVLAVGDPMAGTLYQMSFAATSLFGDGNDNVHPFESYINYLEANGEFTDTVVTRIMYDDESDTMKFKFMPVRHLTQEEVDLVEEAQEDESTEKYYTLTVAQADGVTKKPKSEDEEEDDDEDDEEEAEYEEVDEEDDEEEDDEEEEPAPKKRKPRVKADQPKRKKANIEEQLDEWLEDDEGDD